MVLRFSAVGFQHTGVLEAAEVFLAGCLLLSILKKLMFMKGLFLFCKLVFMIMYESRLFTPTWKYFTDH